MPKDTDTNVFFITGTDEAMISTQAAKLVRTFNGDDPDPFALDVIREQDNTPTTATINQVVRSVLSPSFLPGIKTVWLQNCKSFAAEGTKTSTTPDAVAFRELCKVINDDIPKDIVLILSGPGADQRKALARTVKAKGKLIICNKPEVKDRNWEGEMRQLVKARAKDKNITLPDRVCDYLVGILGTDTARIDSELEKLICYCGGPDQKITLADAQEVCVGQGEAVSWTLRDALGNRDLAEALRLVDVLVRQGKDPDQITHGLLAQVANYFRQLLQVRVFMQAHRLRTPRQIQNTLEQMEPEAQEECQKEGFEFVTFHPYRVQIIAEQALKYSGRELIAAIRFLRDAYWKCVSSSVANRVVLEETIVRLMGT